MTHLDYRFRIVTVVDVLLQGRAVLITIIASHQTNDLSLEEVWDGYESPMIIITMNRRRWQEK